MEKGFRKNLISTSLVKASESNSTKKTGVFLVKMTKTLDLRLSLTLPSL